MSELQLGLTGASLLLFIVQIAGFGYITGSMEAKHFKAKVEASEKVTWINWFCHYLDMGGGGVDAPKRAAIMADAVMTEIRDRRKS